MLIRMSENVRQLPRGKKKKPLNKGVFSSLLMGATDTTDLDRYYGLPGLSELEQPVSSIQVLASQASACTRSGSLKGPHLPHRPVIIRGNGAA